jgi:hypothetical protein
VPCRKFVLPCNSTPVQILLLPPFLSLTLSPLYSEKKLSEKDRREGERSHLSL